MTGHTVLEFLNYGTSFRQNWVVGFLFKNSEKPTISNPISFAKCIASSKYYCDLILSCPFHSYMVVYTTTPCHLSIMPNMFVREAKPYFQLFALSLSLYGATVMRLDIFCFFLVLKGIRNFKDMFLKIIIKISTLFSPINVWTMKWKYKWDLVLQNTCLIRYVKARYETFCYIMKIYITGCCPSVLFMFLACWWFCCGGDSGSLSVSVYSLREDGLPYLWASQDSEDSVTADGHSVQRLAEHLVWTRSLLDVWNFSQA